MICVCGKEFKGKRSTARFCSGACRLAFHRRGDSVTDSVTSETVTPLSVTEVSVPETVKRVSVTKCLDCETLRLEIKKLAAKIVLLEAENRVRAKSYPSKIEKVDTDDLYKRVIRAKEDRLRGFMMGL